MEAIAMVASAVGATSTAGAITTAAAGLPTIGSVISGIGTAVSAVSGISSFLQSRQRPNIPTPDFTASNRAIINANDAQREQINLMSQSRETARRDMVNQQLAAWGRESVSASPAMALELQREQDELNRIQQRSLAEMQAESVRVETAVRQAAERETRALEEQQQRRRLKLVTGQTGRRSLLTSNARGYSSLGVS